MPDKVKKSTKQAAAEAVIEGFEHHLGPFVIAAEETRMPMVFTDAKRLGNPIIYANASFMKLSGYAQDEILGQPFDFLLVDGADADARQQLEEAFSGSTECDPEVRCRRKDGSAFWAAILISPVKDADGTVVQHFASLADVTRYKQNETQSRMLIDELNHRVKNTLSSVQGIVSQAGRNSSDPVAVQRAIEARVLALARSHDLLTADKWETVGLADLVHSALEPFCSGKGLGARCEVIGNNIRVKPNVVLALSIALHELAVNAVKYGAFANDTGAIHVGWKVKSGPQGSRLVLVWEERGGPPVTQPCRRGFGSQVIERGLAHELQAVVKLEYREAGVHCMIDISAP